VTSWINVSAWPRSSIALPTPTTVSALTWFSRLPPDSCSLGVRGPGFCAEHSAIAAMVTAGEYQIAKIVAV